MKILFKLFYLIERGKQHKYIINIPSTEDRLQTMRETYLYEGNIFVLFSSLDQAEKFKKYFSSKHPNINFLLEKENDGRSSFLDINIFREIGKFVTNVYRKKTFSGVYTNFDSFIPETYKTGSVKSLLFRCFNLCSDFVEFHHEINIIKSILYKSSYPRDFVGKCCCKYSV